MKKNVFAILACSALLVFLGAAITPKQNNSNIKALLIAPYYYGANTMLMLDECEKYGIDVTITGLTRQITPCSWASGRKLPALNTDSLISEIRNVESYDCIILTNASWRYSDVYSTIMDDSLSMQMIRKAADKGLVVYMACGAPRVLAKAGKLNGRTITGVSKFKTEYTATGAIYKGENIMPVIDSNYVSSTRGMYYYTENFDAMLAAIHKRRAGK